MGDRDVKIGNPRTKKRIDHVFLHSINVHRAINAFFKTIKNDLMYCVGFKYIKRSLWVFFNELSKCKGELLETSNIFLNYYFGTLFIITTLLLRTKLPFSIEVSISSIHWGKIDSTREKCHVKILKFTLINYSVFQIKQSSNRKSEY